jgi:hypothetical protein
MQATTADVDQTPGRRKAPRVSSETHSLIGHACQTEPENGNPGNGECTHIKKCPMTDN